MTGKLHKYAMASSCILPTIVLVLLSPGPSQGEPMFENSTDLCNRCNCTQRANTLFLNCTARGMPNTLANWPAAVDGVKVTRVLAHFNHNDMKKLEPLPQTFVELLVFYARNDIQDLASGLFTNCANVTSLDLSYNRISSDKLITDVFRGGYSDKEFEPIALRTLILAHNNLHTLGKNLFQHLVDLRLLDLSGNRFRIVDQLTLLSFRSLPRLEYLNLAGNRLIHLNNTSFNFLTNLHVLDLSYNDLDFIPLAVKDVSKTLVTLRIDGNPIIEITEESLLGMEVLVELSATNLSLIEEIKTNAFGTLKNLRKIDLSHIGQKTMIADHIFSASLREMNLSNSNLEILSSALVNWTQLEVLDLRGNQLYCTCVLHNISLQLQDVVKRDRNAPYCFDYKRYRQYEVYSLNEDICFEGEEYLNVYGTIVSTERVLRMILLSISVLLIICLCVALWLGYIRCCRNPRYPFTASYTTATYNHLPVSMNSTT